MTLLETMGALAQDDTPLATIIKQSQELTDQAKQCLDAKALHLPSRPGPNHATETLTSRDLINQ